jgi:hypothetical protein
MSCDEKRKRKAVSFGIMPTGRWRRHERHQQQLVLIRMVAKLKYSELERSCLKHGINQSSSMLLDADLLDLGFPDLCRHSCGCASWLFNCSLSSLSP